MAKEPNCATRQRSGCTSLDGVPGKVCFVEAVYMASRSPDEWPVESRAEILGLLDELMEYRERLRSSAEA